MKPNKNVNYKYKRVGDKTVLKEMRQIILEQAKEWLKWNAQPKYIYTEDGQTWIDNAQLLNDFETDMNKLWEGEK